MDHAQYGTRMHVDDAKFFPRGIKRVDMQVQYVRAMVGACCPYPNKVTTNTVWYCSSGKAGDDCAMQAHIDAKRPLRVYVIDREDKNESTNKYVWGDAVVVAYTDETIHRGKLHKRYTLERVVGEPVPQALAPAVVVAPAAGGGRKRQLRSQLTSESDEGVVAAIVNNNNVEAVQSPRGLVPPRRKKSRGGASEEQWETGAHALVAGEEEEEEEEEVLQQEHVGPAPTWCAGVGEQQHALSPPHRKRHISLATVYRGNHFKSRLEARTAVFLDSLGVSWQYEGVTISYVNKAKTYTVDFHLPEVPIYLEIKPSYPTDEEIEKATYLCRHQRRDVAIVYNTLFAPPFKRTRTLDVHQEPTIRALLLRCDAAGVVTWTENCVWKQQLDHDSAAAGSSSRIVLEPRFALEDVAWRTDMLIRAYAAASTHAF